jgi:hypothetical protein
MRAGHQGKLFEEGNAYPTATSIFLIDSSALKSSKSGSKRLLYTRACLSFALSRQSLSRYTLKFHILPRVVRSGIGFLR